MLIGAWYGRHEVVEALRERVHSSTSDPEEFSRLWTAVVTAKDDVRMYYSCSYQQFSTAIIHALTTDSQTGASVAIYAADHSDHFFMEYLVSVLGPEIVNQQTPVSKCFQELLQICLCLVCVLLAMSDRISRYFYEPQALHISRCQLIGPFSQQYYVVSGN